VKRSTATILQTAIVTAGIAIFIFLLWEPTVEGRNAHATLFETYFNDPLLACAYLAAIALFVALYQLFKLLGDAGQTGALTHHALHRLRTIRWCALIIIAFVLIGEAYLFFVVRGTDDIAGGVGMGIVVALASAITAAAIAMSERRLLLHSNRERPEG
jgi:hypothetical protein